MKLVGERVLNVPREMVWRALNDPGVLRQAIPGCESFEKTGDNAFHAVVSAKIGPVQAQFEGNLWLTDLNPPDGYTISGEGSGGAAGTARGSARVTLEPVAGGATRLAWEADAQISGKLAQVGSKLIESAANMVTGHFFDRFHQIVSGDQPSELRVSPMPIWGLVIGTAVIGAIALYFLFR